MFALMKHKGRLKKAFSECFDPLKSVLFNVPIPMQTSRYITASILGTCRGYATTHDINEKSFDLIVDAVFEEVYRQNSVAVQTRTEAWLHEADEEFMPAYYAAKEKAIKGEDLSWLAEYAKENFKIAFEVDHLT